MSVVGASVVVPHLDRDVCVVRDILNPEQQLFKLIISLVNFGM